jgi:hypothetical protein
MENINNPSEIARIDQLLNELDQFSKSAPQPSQFYAELLRRLNHLVGSQIAWLVHASTDSTWHILAREGEEAGVDSCNWLSEQSKKHSEALPERLMQRDSSGVWLGVSLRPIGWDSGGIVVRLLPTTPPAADLGLLEILSAFCEITNSFVLNNTIIRWESLRAPLRSIANEIAGSQSEDIAARILVNGVRSTLDADRVTLIRKSNALRGIARSHFTVLAISNATTVNKNSPIVHELLNAAKSIETSENGNDALAILAKQHQMAATIAVPIAKLVQESEATSVLTSSQTTKSSIQDTMIVQWAQSDRYHRAASVIADVVPRLSDAWNDNQRVVSVPAKVRAFFLRAPSLTKRSQQVLWLSLIIAGLVFFFSSAELNIRGTGTLQPTTQRFLFAPADGYIEEIFVKDGEQVSTNQLIATINSPTLQLEINRIDAEIELVDEMKSGFELTINQLQSSDEKSVLLANQLAGEIKELEMKRESLVTQRNLIQSERQRLKLLSPTQGTIIAWDIESQLENRPVKQGDTLFRIADVGPESQHWRIEVPVADWESGYVSKSLDLATEKSQPMKVQFALPSEPRKTWEGSVTGSGTSLYSHQGSQHLDFYVQLDKPIPNPRIGTSAIVSFPCGNCPRWFVWTRAMLDAIHRRFWL